MLNKVNIPHESKNKFTIDVIHINYLKIGIQIQINLYILT